MYELTQEEKIYLTDKNLNNAKLTLMELINTQKFNEQTAKNKPHLSEKIKGLNIVIQGDIDQTSEYINFLDTELKSLKLFYAPDKKTKSGK